MDLTVFNEFVLKSFESRNEVDVIFTVFAKSFDRVNHGVLIEIYINPDFVNYFIGVHSLSI